MPTRSALLVADAAARAVESVGLPEARYNLAQAPATSPGPPSRAACVDELAAAAEHRAATAARDARRRLA